MSEGRSGAAGGEGGGPQTVEEAEAAEAAAEPMLPAVVEPEVDELEDTAPVVVPPGERTGSSNRGYVTREVMRRLSERASAVNSAAKNRRIGVYLKTLASTGYFGIAREAAGVKSNTVRVWRRMNWNNFRDEEQEAWMQGAQAMVDRYTQAVLSGDPRLLATVPKMVEAMNKGRSGSGSGGSNEAGAGIPTAREICAAAREMWTELGDYFPPAEPVTIDIEPAEAAAEGAT